MTRRAVRHALFALTLFSAAPAMAQPVTAAIADVVTGVATLKPGDYVWTPEAATGGDVTVLVSIPDQVAHIYRGTTLIGITTVSTGKPGNDTPVGRFTILQKKVDHVSNLYNAPMPYMQRLTWDGIALHAGRIPGTPASHGCVRLPKDFARLLYGVTAMGASVEVTDLPMLARIDPIPAEPMTVATKPQPETVAVMDAPVSAGAGS